MTKIDIIMGLINDLIIECVKIQIGILILLSIYYGIKWILKKVVEVFKNER